MNASTVITDAQRQGMEFVTTAQERILKLNKDLAETVNGLVANLPEMPELPLPEMPQMPSLDIDPSAMLDESYELTTEWLESQRKFAKDLYAIWRPVETTEPVKKAAPKKAAAKKTAK